MSHIKKITSPFFRYLNKYCLLIILPISFVFFGLNKYPHLISFFAAKEAIWYSFFTVLLFYLVPKFKYDHYRSSLIAIWIGILFLFYRDIFEFISKAPFLHFIDFSPVNLGFSVVITIGVIFLILRSSEKKIIKSYNLFTKFGLVFLIINLLMYGLQSIQTPENLIKNNELEFIKNENTDKPDVYCILLDEYSGFEAMNFYHNNDNSEFKNKLKGLGFFVANNSSSNYNSTWISCPSLLSMNYLDNYILSKLEDNQMFLNGERLVFKNNIFPFFKSLGYSTVNNSFFNIHSDYSNKDVIIHLNKKLLIENTFFEYSKGSFLNHIPYNKAQEIFGTKMGSHFIYNQSVINFFYDDISQKQNKPRFIYTHLLMPHPPYLFSTSGVRNFREAYKVTRDKQSKYYIEYVNYTNQVVYNMINSILNKNRNSIIIITSDHGDRFSEKRSSRLDFSNLFAVYKPDKNYTGFSDSINTVNIFRTLLNNQFKQNLSILQSQKQDVLKIFK